MRQLLQSARGLTWSGLLALPLLAQAQLPAQPADCRDIASERERLACYDRIIDAARAAVPTSPVPSAAAAAPLQTAAGTMTDRWELQPGESRGTFLLRPYKPVYVLPVVVADGVNRSPATGNPNTTVPVTVPLDRTEAKFQLSMKTKLAQGLLGDTGDIWAGYTQTSRWQVYNSALSRPFRETNYEPEVMFVARTPYSLWGWQGRFAGLSFNHQSNGRSEPLSRSWNRVIAMAGLERGPWGLQLQHWWRVKEASEVDNNPNIQDFIGRAEMLLTHRWNGHLLSLQLRHSLRSDTRSRGSAEVEWAFPLAGNLRGRLQLFSGHGESLIDYNFRQTRIGLGVSLVEWQ